MNLLFSSEYLIISELATLDTDDYIPHPLYGKRTIDTKIEKGSP
jgi:hypothetical protein